MGKEKKKKIGGSPRVDSEADDEFPVSSYVDPGRAREEKPRSMWVMFVYAFSTRNPPIKLTSGHAEERRRTGHDVTELRAALRKKKKRREKKREREGKEIGEETSRLWRFLAHKLSS